MKMEAMGVFAPLSKNEMKDLLNETRETLAVDVKTASHNRVFGSVDLWNIQKKHRSGASMTRRLR